MAAPVIATAAPAIATAAPEAIKAAAPVAIQAIKTTGDVVGVGLGNQALGIAGEQIGKTREFAERSIESTASAAREATVTVAQGVVKEDSERKSENVGRGLTAWVRTAASTLGEVGTAVVTAPVNAVVRAAKGTADTARGLIASSYSADEVRRKEAAIKRWEQEIERANASLPDYPYDDDEAVRLRSVIALDQKQIDRYREQLKGLERSGGAWSRAGHKGGASDMESCIVGGDDGVPIALDVAISIVVVILLIAGVSWLTGGVSGGAVLVCVGVLVGLSCVRVWLTR